MVTNIQRSVECPVTAIFSYLMMSFEGHHNKNDYFKIKNLESEQMYNRRTSKLYLKAFSNVKELQIIAFITIIPISRVTSSDFIERSKI
ncbi:MAG: hypothetical protein GY760_14465 [Deltaproteobacteria bacterium]|nr:hypothetical protein [Deltaproteobacteria bacterium]